MSVILKILFEASSTNFAILLSPKSPFPGYLEPSPALRVCFGLKFFPKSCQNESGKKIISISPPPLEMVSFIFDARTLHILHLALVASQWPCPGLLATPSLFLGLYLSLSARPLSCSKAVLLIHIQ